MNSIFAEKIDTDLKLTDISLQIDEFERYGNAHASRIAWIADTLAAAFNLAARDRSLLQQAASLHDIGEKQMNREYIGESRSLTTAERIDLHRHPVIGEQEIAKLGLERGVQLLVRWHHEWWNGAGYPDGIEAEQIPLAARILRVADTFTALTSNRPFRPAMPETEAKKYLTEWAGIEFDPAVVKAFLSIKQPEEITAAANIPDPYEGGLTLV